MLLAYEDKAAYALCVFSLALGPNDEPIRRDTGIHFDIHFLVC